MHIVDDDDDLRAALEGLFGSVGLQTRLHASAASFLAAARPDTPSCLVLDVRLPGVSGLDFQAQLSEAGITLPVVLMTGHGDIRMTVRAMQAGAVNFLEKPFRDQDMLDAVAAAIERDRAQRDGQARLSSVHKRFAALTPREKQVMALVTAGRMNKQIAADLNISEVTVKIHRGSVMRKMAVPSLADLVRASDALSRGQGDGTS